VSIVHCSRLLHAMVITMSHKSDSKPVHDDPEQSKRFIDLAREVEADESTDAVDRAFKKVLRPKPMPQYQDATDAKTPRNQSR
jgi:hypothetical protein